MKEAERATGSKSERVLSDGSRRYDARVSIPVAGGERKRISMSFRTERERDAWLIRELDKVDDGLSVARSRLSFADYLEGWARDRKDLKETTRAEYLRQIERIIRPRFGALKLQKLTSMALQEFYIALGEKGTSGRPLAAPTVRRLHSLIHAALDKAVDDRLIRYNMATTATSSIPKPEPVDKRKLVQPWNQEQIRRFRAVADEDELAALWRVLLVLGLRRGEAAGLTWGALELDRESATLEVQHTRVVVNGSVLVDTPKSAKGLRTITMDERTAGMLRRHRLAQKELRLRMGERWKGSPDADWCFTYTDPVNGGKPIHPDEIYDRFQELVRKAGVPRVKLHALRHMAASAMLASTQDINTVAGRLGHAKATFTVDQYGHLLEAADRSAAEKSAAYMDA